VTRRTRPGATWRTAPRSAPAPCRCSAAPRRCPGSGTAATAPSSTWAAAAVGRPRRCAARPANGTPAGAGGTFSFYRPDGTLLPPSPALPPPDGPLDSCHDADITPETIIPPWYGERLNLDEAIYICLANARTPKEKQQQRDQAASPEIFRPRKWVTDPADWIQSLREHTAV